MKILIVSQYFPPYNTPRAFRTFELAKEFSRIGHDVTVYSLIGNHDNSDLENKYGFTVKDLGPSRFGNADSTGYWNKNIIYRVCAHVFIKYEFPSFELAYLIKNKITDIESYDIVISIAWPFWIHFGIGILKKRSKRFPLWISDCGDPFTGNPFNRYPHFYKKIERWWGNLTDYITIPIEQAKKAYYPEVQAKLHVIPQGFDFSNIRISEYVKNKKLTFVYAGQFYEGIRDPRKFLDYLSTLDIDFVFKIFTNDTKAMSSYEDKLGSKLELRGYISREQLLMILSSADFLVNIKNIGTVQSPSKLIDYTLARRPILTITSDFAMPEKEIFSEFCNYDFSRRDNEIDISEFDIKSVADKFLKLYYEE